MRHNNGGFVNVYAIDILARRGYLTMTPRGLLPSPARTTLGQRPVDVPVTRPIDETYEAGTANSTRPYGELLRQIGG